MFFQRNISNRWLVGLLVALNLFTLAALFFVRNRRNDRRPDTLQVFRRELRLTDEQTARFKTLREAHFERTRPLFRELRGAQQKMIESLGDTPADSTAMLHLRAQRSQVLGQIDSLLVGHYRELQAVCTPEQQAQLEAVFLNAMLAGRDKDKDRRHGRKDR